MHVVWRRVLGKSGPSSQTWKMSPGKLGPWWSNLELIQAVPFGGQVWKQCKLCHLVVKYGTNASGAIWWANLQLMQLAPSGGQIWNQYASGASGGKIGNQCKWRHLVAKFATNSRSFTEINFKLF